MERWREEAVRNEIAFAKTLTLVWCIPCVSREGFIYKKLFQWPPFAFRRFSNIARLQDEGEDLSEDQRLRTQDSGRILRAAVFLPPDAVQPRIRRQVQTLQQVHPCGLLHTNIYIAGSGQRKPPRLVLEMGGLQLCKQPCLESWSPPHFKHKSGGVHAGPTQL